MPRRQRLRAPGLPVHIIQRGNNRQAGFCADEDYRFFLDRFEIAGKRRVCPRDRGRPPNLSLVKWGQTQIIETYIH